MIIFTSALVILLIISTIFFGFYVFLVALVAILCAFIVEIVFVKIRKVEFDKFFVISPLVLTMMMPPRIELWVVAVGSLFGVFFGKAVFGGYGKNVFNPAVVGVLFVTISFPSLVTAANWIHPSIDGFSGATPLSMLNSGGDFTYLFKDLLLGNVPGSIGETFRLGIIIIGVVLIVLKVIDWRIPSVYLLSMFILTGIGYLISPTSFPNPILSLFVGGLLFAAFFVATDPITSPINPKGKIFFAIGLAFFTILIRYFATFQEGIVFAIIIMNAIAPLIDDGLEKNNDVKANLEEEVSQ
jgi:Na+-transporting NADH:ubiquinone oxidoreductase subunit B/electron transport complex protein RnfD